MFNKLQKINTRPKPFEFYTAEALWNDEHTSEQMLGYHLNEAIDVSSRRKEFLDSSVKWIASRFNIGPKTRIADFGCGPGLYTTRFARLGANVTGIDFSKRSIEYAKKTAVKESLDITYINGNYLDCTLQGSYDLITMIMCDFCALSPEQRSRLLARFAEHLVPGGSVLFDVNSLAAFNKRKEAATYELNQLNGFWAKEDYYGFVNTFKYDTEKVVLDKYTIILPDSTKTVYNWFQYFSPESLTAECCAGGFKTVERISGVGGGDYDPLSDEFAFVIGR